MVQILQQQDTKILLVCENKNLQLNVHIYVYILFGSFHFCLRKLKLTNEGSCIENRSLEFISVIPVDALESEKK